MGSFSDWDPLLKLAVVLAVSYWAILWLSAIVWTAKDGKERGSDSLSQTVAVLLVVVFNLPGLILYMILRPHETLAEAYVRNLETEAMLRDMNEQESCFACQKPIRPDFAFCPQCRARLQDACAGCGKPVNLTWAICPYCGRDRLASGATAASQAGSATAPALSITPPLDPTASAPTTDAGPPKLPRFS